jgi:hypothetical protein
LQYYYDENSANEFSANNLEILYKDFTDNIKIVGKGGFVRSFYEVLKSATQTGTLQKMLYSNIASDYKAIIKLFNIGDTEKNYKILEQLIKTDSITGIIKDRYDFITLIYSMRFITIKDEAFGEVINFQIPNYVIKILYFNYFAIEIEKRNSLSIQGSITQILISLAR